MLEARLCPGWRLAWTTCPSPKCWPPSRPRRTRRASGKRRGMASWTYSSSSLRYGGGQPGSGPRGRCSLSLPTNLPIHVKPLFLPSFPFPFPRPGQRVPASPHQRRRFPCPGRDAGSRGTTCTRKRGQGIAGEDDQISSNRVGARNHTLPFSVSSPFFPCTRPSLLLLFILSTSF